MIDDPFHLDAQGNMLAGLVLAPSVSEAVKQAVKQAARVEYIKTFNINSNRVEAKVWFDGQKTYFEFFYNYTQYTNNEPNHPHHFLSGSMGHQTRLCLV